MRPRWLTLLLAVLVGASVCAGSARADDAMFAEQPGPRGFLWEAHHGKRTVYLFGTLHVGSADYSPFTRPVLAALQASRVIVFEVDPTDLLGAVRAMQVAMSYPPGDSLLKHLSSSERRALDAVLAKRHVDESHVARTRLWAVPMVLELEDGALDGLSASYGTESFLGAYAKTHDLPIGQLETATMQIAMLSGAPEAIQHDALVETLDDLRDQKAQQKLGEITKVWHAGDRVALEKIAWTMHASKRPGEKWFAEQLVDRRNLGMADGIERMAEAGKPIFVAVGSLHLVGPRGVAAELARRGWHVVPR